VNVNPCCHQCQLLQEGREGNQEQENESLSVFSFLWVTVDAEVEGRAEITLVFTRTSPVLCGLPTNNKRCCGERWFCWQRGEGGEKSPKPAPPAAVCARVRDLRWLWSLVGADGGFVQGCVLLCVPLCRSSWYGAAGKALTNFQISFCSAVKTIWINGTEENKTLLVRFWQLFPKEKGLFFCFRYTDPRALWWKKVEHSSCQFSFPALLRWAL